MADNSISRFDGMQRASEDLRRGLTVTRALDARPGIPHCFIHFLNSGIDLMSGSGWREDPVFMCPIVCLLRI